MRDSLRPLDTEPQVISSWRLRGRIVHRCEEGETGLQTRPRRQAVLGKSGIRQGQLPDPFYD